MVRAMNKNEAEDGERGVEDREYIILIRLIREGLFDKMAFDQSSFI